MTNEKKLVIKINCQSPKQVKNNATKNPQQMITEWNVKRIGIAGLILLLIILVPVSMLLIKDDTHISNVNIITKPELINRKIPQQSIDKSIITASNIEPLNNQTDASKLEKNKDIKVQQPSVSGNLKKPVKEEILLKNKSVAKESTKLDVKQKTNKLVNGLARAQLSNAIKNKEPVGNVKLPFKADKKYARGIFYFTELRGMKGKMVYHEWLYNGNLIYKRRINILGNRWRASTRKMIQYKSIGSWQVRLIDKDGRLMHEIKFEVIG